MISKINITPHYRFKQQGGQMFAAKRDSNTFVDVKTYWPDLNIPTASPLQFMNPAIYDALSVVYRGGQEANAHNLANIAPIYNLPKDIRVLDVGAHENVFIKTLKRHGFINTLGIDVDPIIEENGGKKINFRDLSLDETFQIIHFSHVLDFFSKGVFVPNADPSIEIFASKLYAHLRDKGFIFVSELGSIQLDTLNNAFIEYGLTRKQEQRSICQIWEK